MECLTWFAPILPGKLETWKALVAEVKGARAEDWRRSRERMGMTREVASLMQTPDGDFLCVYHEAENLAYAYRVLATSDDSFDVWFREQIMEIHGLTPEMLQGPLPAQLVFDYKAG